MKRRKLGQYYLNNPMTDGAGVKLNRLFWRKDTLDIDPFLLIDTFDTKNPEDYLKGFPFHPHRGIQTFTYLINGEIQHKDSLGNMGSIKNGEYQWMSAGSGVFHEEMPKETDHMMGFQLWINLPKSEKMSSPLYVYGTGENIPVVKKDNHTVRVLSGTYDGVSKLDLPGKFPVEVYDFIIEANTEIDIPVDEKFMAFVVPFSGLVNVCGKNMEEKSGATFLDGNTLNIKTKSQEVRLFVFAGAPLDEPIAWRGPIVMNTQEEISQAFLDLKNNNFVKEGREKV